MLIHMLSVDLILRYLYLDFLLPAPPFVVVKKRVMDWGCLSGSVG